MKENKQKNSEMEILLDEPNVFWSRDEQNEVLREKRDEVNKHHRDVLDWSYVWYRLDDGRGRIIISSIKDRIPKTTNNAQAIPQAIEVLQSCDQHKTGSIAFRDFERIFNNLDSWKQGVLTRVAMDVVDKDPVPFEAPYFDVWVNMVEFVRHNPSSAVDFNWRRILPRNYNRNRLLHHVYYRSELIHPARVKEWILRKKAADSLPNNVAIQLLGKAEIPLQEADTNGDGYLEYEEFLRFVRLNNAAGSRNYALRRGALAVIPRYQRTLETRRYIEEYSCCPPPLCMLIITLVELAIFIFYAVDMNVIVGPRDPCPLYSPLVYNPARRYEAWRYATYMLIHSGWVHLVNNLLVQFILGVLLELVHKWWRILLIYVAGVITGALLHSVFTPDAFLAGASGGVYAIEYAHLGNLFLNWSEMEENWLQLIVMLVIMSLDLGYAFWDTYLAATPSNTGHMAHFGGALAGVLVGILVLRNLKVEKWERYCQWVSLFIFGILVSVFVILNCVLPVPEYFPENDYSSVAELKKAWLLMIHRYE